MIAIKRKNPGIIALILIGAAAVGYLVLSQLATPAFKENIISITEVSTNRAMYSPKEKAVIEVKLSNMAEKTIKNGVLELQVKHLNQEVGSKIVKSFTIGQGANEVVKFSWDTPDVDFQGYLAQVSAYTSKGVLLDIATVGIDVSSSWIKFPRYGYLHDFSRDIDTEELIKKMNSYHLNGIEYYDWHYLHHQPLAPGITKGSQGRWKDWAGREISGETLNAYIASAKERNMVNMAYNMIYAGTDTFFIDEDGNETESNLWKLYFAEDNNRGKGEFTFRMGTSPSGNGNLYFINPLNPSWQNHIFTEENKVFEVFDFDGWHGDTVGDWGKMVTFDGKPLGFDEENKPVYSVLETYTPFLNAAKEALGEKYLSFNPVGAQGIEYANVSNTDVLYAEFWPWDRDRKGRQYDTYYSLVKEIERSMEESKEKSIDGKGKSLVVKAYINYDVSHGFMNEPGVILCDAAVYASGGSRLEIGNGDHMLHVEYYPDDNILMGYELKGYMRKMSDFIVAYENILRDGQVTTDNTVVIDKYITSKTGMGNTVWTYTRTDENYEILHLINLLGTDNKWRDVKGKKEKPEVVKDLKVKYYTDMEVKSVYMASPDLNECRSIQLAFKTRKDDQGNYLEIVVPSLEYWDMIYMSSQSK